MNSAHFTFLQLLLANALPAANQNPSGDTSSADRGESLMPRLDNGALRNLTKEAGFGSGTRVFLRLGLSIN